MSKYVPPKLRKQTIEKVEINEFPILGNNQPVSRTIQSNDGSYADKAENWRQQRLQDEHNKKVEAEMELYRSKKAAERKLEDELISKASPFKNRTVKQATTAIAAPIKEDDNDGWQVVQKKKRKERSDKVDFNEVPEDFSSNSEDDEHYDHEPDKDTLWK